MALLKGRLFAGALFVGALLGGTPTDIPETPAVPPSTGAGGGKVTSQNYAPPSAPDEYHEAVRRSRIEQEDEDLMVLVTAFLRVMT